MNHRNETMTKKQVSAKQLGELALPYNCRRCFWIKSALKGKLPFQSFPGIFSSIDSYTRKMVKGWFERHGEAPEWVGGMGDLKKWIAPPGAKKFCIDHEESGLVLSGTPDALFEDIKGKLIIVDFKTSKITTGQQKLMPLYELQLNAYALIAKRKAETFGFPEVGGLFLLYTEPVTDGKVLEDDTKHGTDEVDMTFKSVTVPVELNEDRVHALLGRAAEILASDQIPSSRRGCYECERIEGLTQLNR